MSLLFSFLVFLCSGIFSVQEGTLLEVQFGQPARSALSQSKSAGDTARVLLFLLENSAKSPEFPAEGPFPLSPGPIFAWDLTEEQMTNAAMNGALSLETPQASFPEPLETVFGPFKGQLALIVNGAPFGRPKQMVVTGAVFELTFATDRPQTVSMTLDGPMPRPLERVGPDERIHEITLASPLLARTRTADGNSQVPEHKAFVVLPNAYDELDAPRRRWPVIYVIPGSRPAIEHARSLAKILHEPRMKELIPQAIWVVLDPDSAHGHHYFTDCAVHGSRSDALIMELIPWLDVRYRTVPESSARILLGEEQGGRAALTLLLEHPDVFSKAWSLSPDAVSFEALGCLDLSNDSNAFIELDESERPAVRTVLNEDREIVHLDVKDEILLAETLSADGRSGQRWDELRAAFGVVKSRRNPARWPFETDTGDMRRADVMHWMGRDLTERVRRSPELARRLADDARIFVGTYDERYRNLGVKRLQMTTEEVLKAQGTEPGPWVVEMDKADSRSANAISRLSVHDEIITVLRGSDLHD